MANKAKEAPVKETKSAEDNVPSTDFLEARKITIKYLKKESDYIKDPKHAGYGGLFVGSAIAIPPPLMNNGKMKNLLTDKEKKGLEFILGKSLSIYGDFWKEEYEKGSIFPIYLDKDDKVLDLSDPMQFIVWKVLMASPIVANNLGEIRHRATNRFVMVEEGEEVLKQKESVGSKVVAFKKYVEFENNKPVLRYILRNLGRYTDKNQKLDFLQVETAKMIEKDANMFVSIVTDEYIKTKVILEEAFEYGVVNVRDHKYYTKEDQPISDGNSPTLEVAAEYLAKPLGQEMRLAIEAKLKQAKG